jgi:hypothetical protein
MGNSSSVDDSRTYRDGYPGKKDDPSKKNNLLFYQNKLRSSPHGDIIVNIHEKWKGNYQLLESHHGYIQWLFPIREDGLNSDAQQLQLHEAEAIKNDPILRNRVILSYELMLDFYGMKLVSKETGEIERSTNYKSQFYNLNHSFHNYLRITRILKFLGEVGFENFKKPFVLFVLKEIFEHNELVNCLESCDKYWSQVLRNEKDYSEVRKYIKQNKKNQSYSSNDDNTEKEMGEQEKSSSNEEKGIEKHPKLNENMETSDDVAKTGLSESKEIEKHPKLNENMETSDDVLKTRLSDPKLNENMETSDDVPKTGLLESNPKKEDINEIKNDEASSKQETPIEVKRDPESNQPTNPKEDEIQSKIDGESQVREPETQTEKL